ncbi:MAG: cellulase family glycosylhydrolase [Reichenbachiella sp.]
MKRWITAIICLLAQSAIGQQTSETLKVQDNKILTPCGEQVIIRGVNEMFIWSNDRTGSQILPEIKKTGSNTVRLVWTTDIGTPAELDQLITNTINLGMIPMPELHDATGDLSKVPALVDYWLSTDMLPILVKHQNYLLINIANEAGDHNVIESQFLEIYKSAITQFRDNGIVCPLVIDAPGWGQDIDMHQATWKELQDHDPQHNLIFSVHTWWMEDTNSSDPGSTNKIIDEIKESLDIGMPFIVGEFAPMGVKCAREFDYQTLLSECQKNNIGWMAWSWGAVKNGDCSEMDMTTNGKYGDWQEVDDFGIWGEKIIISDPNSISNTVTNTDYITSYGTDLPPCNLFEFIYAKVLSSEKSTDNLALYPNPFKDSTSLKSVNKVEYTIFNFLGKTVEQGQCSNSCELGNALTPGTYILHLRDNNSLINEKLVKL